MYAPVTIEMFTITFFFIKRRYSQFSIHWGFFAESNSSQFGFSIVRVAPFFWEIGAIFLHQLQTRKKPRIPQKLRQCNYHIFTLSIRKIASR